jgi:hypothetical protein
MEVTQAIDRDGNKFIFKPDRDLTKRLMKKHKGLRMSRIEMSKEDFDNTMATCESYEFFK